MTGLVTRLARRMGRVVEPPDDGRDIDSETLNLALNGVTLIGYETYKEDRAEGRKAGVPRGRYEVALVTPMRTTYIIHQFPSEKIAKKKAEQFKALGPQAMLEALSPKGNEEIMWPLRQIQYEFSLFNTGFMPGDVVEIVSTPEPGCSCEMEDHLAIVGELADVVDVWADEEPIHVHPLDWDLPCAWVNPEDVRLHKAADDPARNPGALYSYDWVARRWKVLFTQEEADRKEMERSVGTDRGA